MPTVRNKFHELGNWHNKISMAAIVTKEALAEKEISPQELKARIDKAIINLNKIEQFVAGADKAIDTMKLFIYEKLGGDTEIPAQKSLEGHS